MSKKPKNANLINPNQETIYLVLSVIPVKIPLCVCIFEKKKKKPHASKVLARFNFLLF